MPVCPNSNPFADHSSAVPKRLCRTTTSDSKEHSGRCITIGLINNMPDTALEATERQFLSLLEAASDGIPIRILLYALPDIPRGDLSARRIEKFYSNVQDLWDTKLDGLIVTGKEPLTPSLKDERCWGTFTKLVEWAQENTRSTVWSCLAAHAAILHSDGIGRVKSNCKHAGIFECTRVSDHHLTAGIPSRFMLPHSRWNGVPEDELTDRGYSILTRTTDAGVDTFVKQQQSLFVYFQGHPEYESDTLLREYRRDVGRYLRQESEVYPSMPRNYFDRETAGALMALQEKAVSGRSEALLTELSDTLGKRSIENTWRPTAVGIYRKWLEYLNAEKASKGRLPRINVIPAVRPVSGPTAV